MKDSVMDKTGARVLVAGLVLFLGITAGCGGGGGGSAAALGGGGGGGGVVALAGGGAIKGPLQAAQLTASTIGGRLLSEVDVANTAQFVIEFEPSDLPVVLVTSGGTDGVTMESPPLFNLRGLITSLDSDNQAIVALTPYSTLAVLIAEHRPGGLNVANYETALANLFNNQPFGLDKTVIDSVLNLQAADLASTSLAASESANIVLASEMLGELVRRLANPAVTNLGLNAEQVLAFLAEDLADGLLDGVNGSDSVNPSGALYANLLTAQLLLEALDGDLRINGSVFDINALSNAVSVLVPGTVAASVVPLLCEDVLTQLRIAVNSAFVLAPSGALDTALQGLDGIAVALAEDDCLASTTTVDTVLSTAFPANAGSLLDVPLSQVPLSDPTDANLLVTNSVQDGEPFLLANASRSDIDLRWSRPNTLIDGMTALLDTEISRYEILIGFQPFNYTQTQEISNAVPLGPTVDATAIGLVDLIPQYIAVRAVTIDGAEGPPSNEICVVPPATDC